MRKFAGNEEMGMGLKEAVGAEEMDGKTASTG